MIRTRTMQTYPDPLAGRNPALGVGRRGGRAPGSGRRGDRDGRRPGGVTDPARHEEFDDFPDVVDDVTRRADSVTAAGRDLIAR